MNNQLCVIDPTDHSGEMMAFIRNAPEGTLLLMATHDDGSTRWGGYGPLRGRAEKNWKITVVNCCGGMANPILRSELFSRFLSQSFNSMSFPWLHIPACRCSIGWVDIIFKSTPQGTAVTSLKCYLPTPTIMMSLVCIPSNIIIWSFRCFWIFGGFSWVHDMVIIQEKT